MLLNLLASLSFPHLKFDSAVGKNKEKLILQLKNAKVIILSFLFKGIGKNVICDRTATPLDAFRMMSAAQYYPKLLSIMGNVLRFLPAFVRMKELLEEGYIGELLVCEAQV